MRFAATAEVTAAPEAVWAVLMDVERWPEWTASVRGARLLTPGPLAVGSEVWLDQPRLRPATWRVTELDAPRSFVWVSTSGGVRSTADHRLVPLADDRVRIEVSLDQSGALAPLVGLLYGKLIRRYLRMEADGLTRRCAGEGPVRLGDRD
jgi:hypothetical protein